MRKRITRGRVNIDLVIGDIAERERKFTELIKHEMSVKKVDYKTAKELVKRGLRYGVMQRLLEDIVA